MSASIDSPSANVNLAWLSAEWSTRSPVPAVPQRATPVNPWQRMRSNADAVRPVLRDAGISADSVRTIRCGSCGLWESAAFWTLRRHEGTVLHLACPRCTTSRVRYDTAGNRIAYPLSASDAARTGVAALLPLFLGVGLWYGVELVPFRAAADRAFDAAVGIVTSTYPEWAPGSRTLSSYRLAAAEPESEGATTRMAVVSAGACRSPTVFIGAGDRRQEVERYLDELEAGYGWKVRRQLLDLRYDPAKDETVVRVSGTPWQRVLQSREEWKRSA